MLYRLDGNFQGERIGARSAMTFEDFGHVANGFGDAGRDVRGDADADEGGDGKADFGGIDVSAKSRNDASVFHLADAFCDGRQGQADAASEFRERNSSILLQLFENVPAGLIERRSIESHYTILL